MKDFKKVVRLGAIEIGNVKPSVFCTIKFTQGRLSITGVEGPKSNGDCYGSCGQIDMDLAQRVDSITPAPGWDFDMLCKFFQVWDKWHLNDMQAGSPAQMAELANHTCPTPTSHFDWALDTLRAAGLQPDPSCIHKGKPYSYGTAWMRVEVPEEVLEWLAALPDTDITPAWV